MVSINSDEPNAEDTHGHVFSFKQPGVSQDDLNAQTVQSNLTASEAQTWLMQHSPSTFQRMLESNYSNGIERSEEQLKLNNQDPTKWANPLEVTLPYAPSMKIYCLYGHGKPTERSYWYAQGEYERDEHVSEGEAAQCADCDNVTVAAPLGLPLGRTTWIDTSIQKEDATPKVRAGCKMGEGDGTVSLLSLGAMCAEGWKKKRYNHAGSTIVTHEVRHEPDGLDLRGGQTTGDHVDILGAWRVNDYIGRIAAGRGSEVQDHYVSRIQGEFSAFLFPRRAHAHTTCLLNSPWAHSLTCWISRVRKSDQMG